MNTTGKASIGLLATCHIESKTPSLTAIDRLLQTAEVLRILKFFGEAIGTWLAFLSVVFTAITRDAWRQSHGRET